MGQLERRRRRASRDASPPASARDATWVRSHPNAACLLLWMWYVASWRTPTLDPVLLVLLLQSVPILLDDPSSRTVARLAAVGRAVLRRDVALAAAGFLHNAVALLALLCATRAGARALALYPHVRAVHRLATLALYARATHACVYAHDPVHSGARLVVMMMAS